ncbi:hypothetical protein JHK87_025347 [Glycine soja]|nr:hypothetical protein JHK87_025347 [Glycine soja]
MGRIQPLQSSGRGEFDGEVEKIQGFDFANWLKKTVSKNDFVVMKMDVEGGRDVALGRGVQSMRKHMIHACSSSNPLDKVEFLFISGSNCAQHDRGRRNFKGNKKQHSMPNAHVRSELRYGSNSKGEADKANRVSYIKSKSTTGKRFGKNGKKRKGK